MSTDILTLDEVISSQADKFITHNTSLRQIEGQTIRALSRANTGPPGSPTNGDVYIVDVLSGAWSGATLLDIAHYYGGAWYFYTPIEGLRLYVNAEDVILIFDGTDWNSQVISTKSDLSVDGSLVVESGVIVIGAGGGADPELDDNTARAYVIKEGTNDYLVMDTVDGNEVITAGNSTQKQPFVSEGPLNTNDDTQSTSTTTGALKTAGGLGVVKDMNVGGVANLSDKITHYPTVVPGNIGSVSDGTNLNDSRGVDVHGDYAYVASYGNDSVSVIDVSDPTSPVRVGTVSDATNLNGAWGIEVLYPYAYVACYEGDSLTVVDISDPSSPTVVGQLIDATNLNQATAVSVAGRYAYVASYVSDTLCVIDISDPTAPTMTGVLTDSTNLQGARGVRVTGKFAYVAAYDARRFTIVDISDPTTPTLTGSINDATLLNGATEISVENKYAYVTAINSDTFCAIDISDPTTPTIAGSVTDGSVLNGISGLVTAGNYAYVVSITPQKMAVIDISDPTTPVILRSNTDATGMNFCFSLAIAGNYVYVVTISDDSLTVIDIQGLTTPSAEIGIIKTSKLKVTQRATISRLDVDDGFNVGGNALIAGELAVEDDIHSSNIIIDSSVAGNGVTLKDPAVAHGITDIAETDVYGHLRKDANSTGGLRIEAFAENANALRLISTGTGGLTSDTGRASLDLFVSKKNGATEQSMGDAENCVAIVNNAATIGMFKGNGDLALQGGLRVNGGTDLLDTYEEGDWTPELWDNTLATEGTPPTYSNQVGRYTRIGDLVHIQGRVAVSSLGGLTLTETLRMGGLPFTAENITNSYSALSVARGRGLAISAGNTISGWVRLNTSYIELEQWDAIGGSTVMLVSEFSATGDIMFSATYKA